MSVIQQPRHMWVLDDHVAAQWDYKTVEEWLVWYAQKANEQGMAAVPDFYRAGKSASEEFLKEVRTGFRHRTGIITDTCMTNYADDLKNTIEHYAGRKVVTSVKQEVDIVPVFHFEPLLDVVTQANADRALKYLQALFNTKDSSEEVMRTLERLADTNRSRIMISTSNRESRIEFPKGTVALYYYEDRFNIDASYRPENFRCCSWPLVQKIVSQ